MQTTDRLLVASTLLLRMLDCGKLRLPAVAALHVLMMVPVTLKVVVANVVVMVLQAVEVDFFRVDQVRKAVRDSWKARHGHSLTYLPFIGNAVCRALLDFPHLNSSVDGDSLLLHEHVNLAIAVDLGAEGLVAPVIKEAEKMSVAQLADAIADIAHRSRTNRLKPNDFAGGTYTLSNSGTFGTLITAPIINQPQLAIMTTGAIVKRPVVKTDAEGNDYIAIRSMMFLGLSHDHRLIDGLYAVQFTERVKQYMESYRIEGF